MNQKPFLTCLVVLCIHAYTTGVGTHTQTQTHTHIHTHLLEVSLHFSKANCANIDIVPDIVPPDIVPNLLNNVPSKETAYYDCEISIRIVQIPIYLPPLWSTKCYLPGFFHSITHNSIRAGILQCFLCGKKICTLTSTMSSSILYTVAKAHTHSSKARCLVYLNS